MYAVGPGGYEIRLSPGSVIYPLKRSKAGHLMLPCAEFEHGQPCSEVMTFVVGPHFEQERSSARLLTSHRQPDVEVPKAQKSESIDGIFNDCETLDGISNAASDELDKLAASTLSGAPRAKEPSPAGSSTRSTKKTKGNSH